MSNPLLEDNILPTFSAIKPEHIEPAIDELLDSNRKALQSQIQNDAAQERNNGKANTLDGKTLRKQLETT